MMSTAIEVRRAVRLGYITLTSGLAPSYLQANLIVLPARYAQDFRLLCQRNPVPCPLLAESLDLGSYSKLRSYIPGIPGERLAAALDLRLDIPRYMVYVDGQLHESHTRSIETDWQDDHIAFLIGCSYSFENALTTHGLQPRHTLLKRNVPMYRTALPLCPAGIFTKAVYVVSMRPYKRSDVENVRAITRPYQLTHGEPIAWGWDAVAMLGIKDIHSPEWGDAPLNLEGEVFGDASEIIPVFWGCGVTPQEAVMSAGLEGVVLGHAPGHMLMLDVKDEDVSTTPIRR